MVEVFFGEQWKKVKEREREILIIIKNDFESAIQNGFICHDLLQEKMAAQKKIIKKLKKRKLVKLFNISLQKLLTLMTFINSLL